MSYICGMNNCKSKNGPCTHEIIVAILIVLIAAERLIVSGI